MLLSDIPLGRSDDRAAQMNERYQKSERQLYLHAGSLVAMHCGARRLSNPKKKPPCEMDEGVLGFTGPEHKHIILDYPANSFTYP
jgi:hypothetical protein